MIKPEDIRDGAAAAQANDIELAEIEKYFDEAIERAAKTSKWPAEPHHTRSGWSQGNIDAVVEKYRAAGWHVTTGDRAVMCRISRPQV